MDIVQRSTGSPVGAGRDSPIAGTEKKTTLEESIHD
jgi:hypothetical protein